MARTSHSNKSDRPAPAPSRSEPHWTLAADWFSVHLISSHHITFLFHLLPSLLLPVLLFSSSFSAATAVAVVCFIPFSILSYKYRNSRPHSCIVSTLLYSSLLLFSSTILLLFLLINPILSIHTQLSL